MVRRSSTEKFDRIDHIRDQLVLHQGDLLDQRSLVDALRASAPHEIYNLAAMSFVAVSWVQPTLTAEFSGVGVTRILEAMREVCPDARFYQASSSEMFGSVRQVPQTELTPFYPRSPYGVAKAYGHFITVNYRESYDLRATSGILFNHESPRRGETFVSRKITRGLTRVQQGLQSCVYLGNLEARRDWGHARDYVDAQWRMLQREQPQDYVIATGVQHSVRDFVDKAATLLGMRIEWRGKGAQETGFDRDSGSEVIRIDPRYFRPTEVDSLLGDASRARRELNWTPTVTFDELVHEMVEADRVLARRDALVARAGYGAAPARE